MFTIIDDEIYQVSGEKMRRVIIDEGSLKVAGEPLKYDTSSVLITANELRRQYAELFKVKEDIRNNSDEKLLDELQKKDEKIKELEDEISKLNDELKEKDKTLESLKNKDDGAPNVNVSKENKQGE